jgi:predicted membrane protein (TIGR00267 family)
MDQKKEGIANTSELSSLIREVVFGMEDGMVSTLGAITGIATGSGERYTVILAGLVIIAVESISMGIGSYISNFSSREVEKRIVDNEKKELRSHPDDEKKELLSMLLRDGWSRRLASKMSMSASLNKKLMLKEHEYRELGIFPYEDKSPLKNSIFMFISYVIGGSFPLFSYFVLPINNAIYISVVITIIGLFLLGVSTTFFTNSKPLKSGIRLVIMGGIAFLVGLLVGKVATYLE